MQLFQTIYQILKPKQRRAALYLFILMLGGMLLETFGVGLIVPLIALLIDDTLPSKYPQLQPLLSALGEPDHTTLVLYTVIAFVALYTLKNIYLAFLNWRQNHFGYSLQIELSQRLFRNYLYQPYSFHLQRNSSELIRNIGGEVGMTISAINSLALLIAEIAIVVGIVALLLIVEPLGALSALILFGSVGALFQFFTRKLTTAWGRERQYHDGLRNKHLLQGLGGVKDVKLFGREKEFCKSFDYHTLRSGRTLMFYTTLQQTPKLWLEVIAVSAMAALVAAMIGQGRSVEALMPVIGLFAAAAFRLLPSVNRILGSIQSLRYSAPAISTVRDEIRSATVEESTSREQSGKRTFSDSIEIEQLTFRYPNAAAAALKAIDLKISKGETVGFVGASGSGKSTLIDLILGLLTPTSGTIRIDGVDLQSQLRHWQRQVGYVPQSIYLTDDTLRRNIAFGIPEEEIDEKAVERAVKAAQLQPFVDSLPEGSMTEVGERGVRLSGGQRQRIGIARALYHDPEVLVLDEATSALDNETEKGVMEAVDALHGTKTILIVAHRLTTVEKCDRIVRLEDGNVSATGTPRQLLKSKS